ncbi:MAG: M28 family metallopeptidase [Candidatus Baldrarchaeia archaeon]
MKSAKIVPFIFLFILFSLTLLEVPAMENEAADVSWFRSFVDEDPESAYNYAASISRISLNTSLSHYSFRVGGSPGEYFVYRYIESLLNKWNISTHTEEFSFINWDIFGEPNITIMWGNSNETYRIYPEHYTFGTPIEGLKANICHLPLPKHYSRNPLPEDIAIRWNKTNVNGKIVLIGREVLFNENWAIQFLNKILIEKPSGILYSWATEEYKEYPFFHSSTGGRRIQVYKDYMLPVAWVEKSLTNKLIQELESNKSIIGVLKIPINENEGVVRNIIATIPGIDTSKEILVTAHYDSVMASGLSDNGAGVAGVLEIAWAFSKAYREGIFKPHVNITFVFFTSEEAGLVGSAKYVELHKAKIDNIIAVINLDSIGSLEMSVSVDEIGILAPSTKECIYLHDLINSIAESMEIKTSVFSDMIHSDDSTFANPSVVKSLIENWWGIEVDIGDVSQRPAVMICSAPLFPWEREDYRGWIHTPYDNVTSTEIYDWVNPSRLETHIKVAGLTILKLLELFKEESREEQRQNTWLTFGVLTAVCGSMLIIVLVKKRLSIGK